MKQTKKPKYQRIRADSGYQRRIFLTAVILGIALFLPIMAQLYSLMVISYDYYAARALRNQGRTTAITANRGDILDRNMNILASSVGVETVYLDPQELRQAQVDIPRLAQVLAEILDLDPAWIEKKACDTKMRYQQIAANIDTQTASKIRSYINAQEISGVHLEPSAKRYYPYGSLAAQVVGFVNASNAGCEGIEAAYNAYLEGEIGKVITTKGNNEMDMPFSYENLIAPQKGDSVVLTLDATVQACLEKRMQEAIDKYSVQNGAFGIVMNVNTGEILAMATLGSYDPNNYLEIFDTDVARQAEKLYLDYLAYPLGSEEYTKRKEAYQQFLSEARLKQWRNRCISDGYEPGSTFKVLTMAAALDCGAITLETPFYCRGAEQIPGRSQLLHCWKSVGHGSQKTPQALQNSCNLAFAHIALSLGGERFYEYVKNFGILEKTGIDLYGESKGVFFSKELVTNTEKWGTASLTSGSFGQTFKLTPLQLVRAISAVVNGGNLMEPYIVSEVLDRNGNTVLSQEPTVIRKVISEKTSQIMRQLMRSVVTEGTAKNASVAGFSIGGKTGTSEKIDVLDRNGKPTLDKIVSFVGVAPMENPEYIVLVALDTPSRETGMYISGGVMAAPTVGAVMMDILPYLGVSPSFSPEEAAGKTLIMPDLTGMSIDEVKKTLKELEITFVASGDDAVVTGQIPAAGEKIPGNSQAMVYFGENPPQDLVMVPDFAGMDHAAAEKMAKELGLYILSYGNQDRTKNVVVTQQSPLPDTTVPVGTTVTLLFTDTKAAD